MDREGTQQRKAHSCRPAKSGRYQLCVTDPYAYTGSNFGDVQANGQFVDWGAYNTAHKY